MNSCSQSSQTDKAGSDFLVQICTINAGLSLYPAAAFKAEDNEQTPSRFQTRNKQLAHGICRHTQTPNMGLKDNVSLLTLNAAACRLWDTG